MGVAACLSDLYDSCHHRHGKKLNKKNQLQTVEIKVKMDCEGCERRVRKSVGGMKGVSSVEVDPKKSKLTVVGYVDPEKVLNRVRQRTGKKAEMWPYVPYDVVEKPYVPGVYDKKAPPGYVRNTGPLMTTDQGLADRETTATEIRYITAFSDDNPTACMVM